MIINSLEGMNKETDRISQHHISPCADTHPEEGGELELLLHLRHNPRQLVHVGVNEVLGQGPCVRLLTRRVDIVDAEAAAELHNGAELEEVLEVVLG